MDGPGASSSGCALTFSAPQCNKEIESHDQQVEVQSVRRFNRNAVGPKPYRPDLDRAQLLNSRGPSTTLAMQHSANPTFCEEALNQALACVHAWLMPSASSSCDRAPRRGRAQPCNARQKQRRPAEQWRDLQSNHRVALLAAGRLVLKLV